MTLIRLNKELRRADCWGNRPGQEAFLALVRRVEELSPEDDVIELSFAGIRQMDASFGREAIVALGKRFRGERGFWLSDIVSEDMFDNLEAAALRLDQPIYHWRGADARLTGPAPSTGLVAALQQALKTPKATAAQLASDLRIGISNASSKLKALYLGGYLMRSAVNAESGGIEFSYRRIGPSGVKHRQET